MKKIAVKLFAGISFIIAAVGAGTPLTGHAAQEVVAKGSNSSGQTNVTACDEATLRVALEAGGTVTLACDGTILLTNTLVITKDVVLDGTGRNVTLDGGGAIRVLLVQPSVQLTLKNVTVTRGRADKGGGLFNNGGSIVLLDSVFHSNQAVGGGTNRLDRTPTGGAIYSIGGEVVATNSLFATNIAMSSPTDCNAARGGAIAIQDGVLKLEGCRFSTNQASGGIDTNTLFSTSTKGNALGGAVWLKSSTGYAWNCEFNQNLAHSPEHYSMLFDSGGYVYGGAIHQESGPLLELRNCAFVGNRAVGGSGGRNGGNGDGQGGAVSTLGNLVADHCSFANNSCAGGGGSSFWGGHAFGGALYTAYTATLNHCLFSANRALAGSACGCMGGRVNGNAYGGAVYAQGALQVLNSTFASNWVVGPAYYYYFPTHYPGSNAGGALFSTAVCVATNSTWFQNGAIAQVSTDNSVEGSAAGAAIFQSETPLTMAYCTIASNTIVSRATNTSAGIVLVTNAVARLSACLLSGNAQANLAGSIVDEGFNLSSDHSVFLAAASSQNDVNPKLGEFGDHGGAIPTLPLLLGSPAIDAVISGACPETDQRGVPRPTGAWCDIGAFEFVPAPAFAWDSQSALRVERVLQPARDYQIEASSDLIDWIMLSTIRSDDQGKIEFTDTSATNWLFRFYRALPK